MAKPKWSTYIQTELDIGVKAEKLKEEGIAYNEIFRQGILKCEELLTKK